METVVIIQARMGSSRLPGKVMLPLNGQHVLDHVISRTDSSAIVDEVIVATSTKGRDDIIASYAPKFGARIHRGDEDDVLGRMHEAAAKTDADTVVRITADCPLVDPDVIDETVRKLTRGSYDYVSNTIERTFPRGLDVEAFTRPSFDRVERETAQPYEREHVTPYYYENPDAFSLGTLTSDEVYSKPNAQDRTDIRITLDEAVDYELLEHIYSDVSSSDLLETTRIIDFIDRTDIGDVNAQVEQKKL